MEIVLQDPLRVQGLLLFLASADLNIGVFLWIAISSIAPIGLWFTPAFPTCPTVAEQFLDTFPTGFIAGKG